MTTVLATKSQSSAALVLSYARKSEKQKLQLLIAVILQIALS